MKKLPIRRISAAYQERISFRAECEAVSIKIPADADRVMKYEDFNKNECVYCGKIVKERSELTWDHLIPITPPPPDKKNESFVKIDKIGHSVYGNLVRACSSCNSSKGNKDFESWMDSKKFAEERKEKLKKYQKEKECNDEFQNKLKDLKDLDTNSLRKEIRESRIELEKKIQCLYNITKCIINEKKHRRKNEI